ncbi:hypothetical protein SKAU_G00014460 [Synaphobranchus kaupii]|uniref:Uncharacterized protein n=1 Tax=Synaphobranchus kaupii TaxID=118154 RepID=A0A9Q1JCI4_SYNKA|nr:hypothetical protein SKAU_G00014460 [Synaphobranchus kaupii]
MQNKKASCPPQSCFKKAYGSPEGTGQGSAGRQIAARRVRTSGRKEPASRARAKHAGATCFRKGEDGGAQSPLATLRGISGRTEGSEREHPDTATNGGGMCSVKNVAPGNLLALPPPRYRFLWED